MLSNCLHERRLLLVLLRWCLMRSRKLGGGLPLRRGELLLDTLLPSLQPLEADLDGGNAGGDGGDAGAVLLLLLGLHLAELGHKVLVRLLDTQLHSVQRLFVKLPNGVAD